MSDWVPDVERLKLLDDQEWLAVERAFGGRLLAYALRRTGDHQAAEDVLQETLLGAVRGIGDFDTRYSFEQYVFGICKNRTIDHLRRQRPRTLEPGQGDERSAALDRLATHQDTPSRIVRRRELTDRARALLSEVLREWVEEAWSQNEFQRLCVLDALFSGWRNRDVWRRFELRDETAVAGIKFRALKRLRELAAVRESGGDLLRALGTEGEGEEGMLDMDVREVWRDARAACPARHWIARLVAGTLEEGPAAFVRFHLDEVGCEVCRANHDDLAEATRAADVAAILERVEGSTLRFLRSKKVT